MPSISSIILLTCAVLILLPSEACAFGAGDIPDFSYLNNRAFRHGDIENILTTIAKSVGAARSGGGLLDLAASVLSGGGGRKFSSADVKHVYFGNWLRDYSQAMDIAGLSKLSAETLVMVVSVLGFMTFGFATAEYEVTAERLGVYLPVEHIDNPKGYAKKEGDARQFHPKLRPPVQEEELEIDARTGMKKFMATEGRSWDTSTAHIRRTFEACIHYGRRARGKESADLWEAYRLLGTGLHTMEDLLAHSNWCEIALRKLGYEQVFCHVGDRVIIQTPNGPAPPLVTGTFGSADFIHSLMGEATDHLSEASVVDLSNKMNDAQNSGGENIEVLKNLLGKLPFGNNKNNQIEKAENMKAKSFDFNPDDYAPEQVQQQLMSILKWRDDMYRDILKCIEKIPGLEALVDQLTNALNAYVYSLLAPWLAPILQQATGILGEGSKAVIDTDDQYEVFNNLHASDPSHSLLSKDHFGLILNEPAGQIAQVVVEHSVNLIVAAWFDDHRDVHQTINQPDPRSIPSPILCNRPLPNSEPDVPKIATWLGDLDSELAEQTIEALSKENVRAGKNKRLGNDEEEAQAQSSYEQSSGSYSMAGRGHSETVFNNDRNAYQEAYGGQEKGTAYETQDRYSSNSQGYNENYGGSVSSGYVARRGDRKYGENVPQYEEEDSSDYQRSMPHGPQYRDESEGYSYRRDGGYETGNSRDTYETSYEGGGLKNDYSSEQYGRGDRREEQTRDNNSYEPSYSPPDYEKPDTRDYSSEAREGGHERSSYNQSRYERGGYEREGVSGYDPQAYQEDRREYDTILRRDDEETYGAERLNLNEETEQAYEEEQQEYY